MFHTFAQEEYSWAFYLCHRQIQKIFNKKNICINISREKKVYLQKEIYDTKTPLRTYSDTLHNYIR